jgi:hypothetical protein
MVDCSPVDSSGLQSSWQVQWSPWLANPQESTGVYWTPVDSCGLHRTAVGLFPRVSIAGNRGPNNPTHPFPLYHHHPTPFPRRHCRRRRRPRLNASQVSARPLSNPRPAPHPPSPAVPSHLASTSTTPTSTTPASTTPRRPRQPRLRRRRRRPRSTAHVDATSPAPSVPVDLDCEPPPTTTTRRREEGHDDARHVDKSHVDQPRRR